MKNKLVITGILGLSVIAHAKNGRVGIPLIKREDIKTLSVLYDFPDMEIRLLESGIIEEVKLREYYVIKSKRLSEETEWASREKNDYIVHILKDIAKEKITISIKDFRKMMAVTQDFSPVATPIVIDNDRFQK